MATTAAFDKMPEVLYITRKHPPSIGGMQRLSFELRESLADILPVHVIAWGYSQIWLPFFIGYALIRAIVYLALRPQLRVIMIGDPVLAPLALILKKVFRRQVIVIIHGLDITYPARFYQLFIVGCLKRLDTFICISHKTKNEAIKRGLSKDSCYVIPVGIDQTRFKVEEPLVPASEVGQKLKKLKDEQKLILLTVGRLVKRKGVAWFIEHIFTDLVINHPHLCYLIVGDGPQRSEIETIIQYLGLTDNVWLCGEVSEQDLSRIYRGADIFVMPNISVEDDMEGFGIVALEAAVNKVCVVASKLEGIEDAITDQQNGWLVPSGDVEAFQKIIRRLIVDETFRAKFSRQAQEFTITNFSWTNIAALHADIIKKIATSYATQSIQ
jgi:glycosyltransferase involved in cell wall biosynthesis